MVDGAKFQTSVFRRTAKSFDVFYIENELYERLTFLPAIGHWVQEYIRAIALRHKFDDPITFKSNLFESKVIAVKGSQLLWPFGVNDNPSKLN